MNLVLSRPGGLVRCGVPLREYQHIDGHTRECDGSDMPKRDGFRGNSGILQPAPAIFGIARERFLSVLQKKS